MMHGMVTPPWQTGKHCHLQNAKSPAHFILGLVLFLTLRPFHIVSLSSDGLALLQVKASIKSDPLKLLSNWKEEDLDPCSWTGVACDPLSFRVVSLNITGQAFCGPGGPDRRDGFCSSLGFCPSLLWQSPDLQCSFLGDFSAQITGVPLCLRNGTVLEVGSDYRGPDQVPCRLSGSLSPAIGNLSQLEVLSLPFNAFSGRIASELGQLTNLRVLNLAYNSFEDEVPFQLGRCKSVQILNLAGNMLSGKIPAFLGSLPELQSLTLSFNQLDGTIPPDLADGCGGLEHLHLEGNFLIGTIPPGLGNCSNLKSLVVSSNFLSGYIPTDLGRIAMLQALDVSRNSLAGEIPPELGNCSQLSLLVLTSLLDIESCLNRTVVDPSDGYTNKDKGEFNYFTGALPTSIVNLSTMRLLWAPRAGLNENLPSHWGTCPSLEVLNLGQNMFTGGIPTGLVECRKLIYLDLSSNELVGSIPQQLPIQCMAVFNVSGNTLSGGVVSLDGGICPSAELLQPLYIPSDDQRFSAITVYSYFTSLYCGSVTSSLPIGFALGSLPVIHDLSQNNLTGSVPGLLLGTSLINRMPAHAFVLSENQFNGTIPNHLFSSCENLQELAIVLSDNFLEGVLPVESMLGCKSLRHLKLGSNQLTGSLAPEIADLKYLVFLDLGMNNLGGSIPRRLGQLQALEYLFLGNNSLIGEIPPSLGNMTSLIELDLSQNHLTGEIPGELSDLNKLKYMWLNNNSLSGNIPASLARLTSLSYMDLAYNNLSGAVPRFRNIEYLCNEANFVGNPYLQPCSASAPAPSFEQVYVPHPFAMPPSNIMTKKSRGLTLLEIIVISAVCAIIFGLCTFLWWHCKRPRSSIRSGRQPRKKEVVAFANIGFPLTYENVVRATGNFSVDNLIGNGGFGATYKAELRPNLFVAVKRLSLGRFQGIQQFDAEIRTLGRIRHRHLVTLIGYHASESEMFLIYNYLQGGNLETLIHNREKRKICWKVRHKIALNVAQALVYLHNECTPRVLHRDIKPSNILLDNYLDAYLSDFGLARLLGASETHATTDVAGTFGYVAPEYALTMRVSDKADVYSYGVVLLELLSGKKALDPSFSNHGDGFNIVAWACQLHKQGQQKAVFAPGLWEQGPQSELVDVLKLGINCTEDSLSDRPTMKQVVTRLKSCRLTSSF